MAVMSDAAAAHSTAAATPQPARWRLRLLGAVELLDSAGRPTRLPTRPSRCCWPAWRWRRSSSIRAKS